MMGKKSEIVYNSRFQKSSSGLVSPCKSASKISGYPSVIPNKFGDSSSKSDFKLPESSTGGKAPLHGPRRTVKPSRVLGDEFEIERAKFKVNKSQILNYKAICNLAKSHQSGEDAILFGVVRCTYWSLGESMKPGGVVNNFVMAAFCYHLYSRPGGHPEVSKCHYFFSSIGEKLLKDVDSASEDILSRAFTRSSKARPLHRSNLVHVRDKLIPNFKYWWAKLVMLDMGFQMYKVVYPFVPPQPLRICDSGVYAMMFLEYWKSPRSSLFTLFKDSDIPNLRIKLANELLFFSKNTRRKDLVTSYQFEDGEDA